jgi:hypothetical protein
LQCSHLFFTELCTFIPLTWSKTPTLVTGAIAVGATRCTRPNIGLGAEKSVLRDAESARVPKARTRELLMFARVSFRNLRGDGSWIGQRLWASSS